MFTSRMSTETMCSIMLMLYDCCWLELCSSTHNLYNAVAVDAMVISFFVLAMLRIGSSHIGIFSKWHHNDRILSLCRTMQRLSNLADKSNIFSMHLAFYFYFLVTAISTPIAWTIRHACLAFTIIRHCYTPTTRCGCCECSQHTHTHTHALYMQQSSAKPNVMRDRLRDIHFIYLSRQFV